MGRFLGLAVVLLLVASLANGEVLAPVAAKCCRARTAECLSCAAGMGVAAFCKEYGKPLPGCENAEPVKVPAGKACCTAMTASCLACAADVTVAAFCELQPETVGCATLNPLPVPQPELQPQPQPAKPQPAKPESTKPQPSEAQLQPECCNEDRAACLACEAGVTVEVFCRFEPGAKGCTKEPARDCCQELTATCMACQTGVTVATLCTYKDWVPGCPLTETPDCNNCDRWEPNFIKCHNVRGVGKVFRSPCHASCAGFRRHCATFRPYGAPHGPDTRTTLELPPSHLLEEHIKRGAKTCNAVSCNHTTWTVNGHTTSSIRTRHACQTKKEWETGKLADPWQTWGYGFGHTKSAIEMKERHCDETVCKSGHFCGLQSDGECLCVQSLS